MGAFTNSHTCLFKLSCELCLQVVINYLVEAVEKNQIYRAIAPQMRPKKSFYVTNKHKKQRKPQRHIRYICYLCEFTLVFSPQWMLEPQPRTRGKIIYVEKKRFHQGNFISEMKLAPF